MVVDWSVSLAGSLVGFIVGLTGMGGGALMTPVMVLLFGVQPLAAVSSDLVASMIMKPVGGGVHMRRGTVQKGLVVWLVAGSVPAAFAGVLLLRSLGSGPALERTVRVALGVALLLASLALCLKSVVQRRRANAGPSTEPLRVRPLATLAVGVLGGLVVGMTSVGSGSLMMLMLLVLYPRLRLSELVGTDLVQAVPLVASAALAHLFFGNFQLGLTVSILIGAIPGVFIGALLSSKAPDHLIRPVLIVVLLSSGMKLLGFDNQALLVTFASLAAAGLGFWVFASYKRRAVRSSGAAQRAPDAAQRDPGAAATSPL
jgi:uncharacterized membrane protein YfcA